jgi:hypothetical protein
VLAGAEVGVGVGVGGIVTVGLVTKRGAELFYNKTLMNITLMRVRITKWIGNYLWFWTLRIRQ